MDKREVMPKPGKISALWTRGLPGDVGRNIRAALESAGTGGQPPRVFFRADDIGVAGERFSRLMHLFASRRMPLSLAVVPGWLDREGWEKMREYDPASPLWCWHQHGWNHVNHEAEGKKCEFGESRDRAAIRTDLRRGRDRLDLLLGDLFLPVFTPPWNRCSRATLQILAELDFHAVSRYINAQPPNAGILPDLAVNVDLHTRKEADFQLGWQLLLEEMTTAARSGCIGFMLHHQRMNDAAFDFLDILLAELSSADVVCCTFMELLAGGPAGPSPCP